MKAHDFTALIFVLVMTILGMSGCSSGGGGSTTDVNDGVLTLSSSSAVPGEYITLTNSSFSTLTPVHITWSDDNNYSVKTDVYPVANGVLKVSVPVYVDMQSKTVAEGNVTLSVSGISTAKQLNIRRPIEIIYGSGEKPGDLIIEWFRQNRSDYNTTLHTIQNFGTDTAEAEALLSSQISRLDALIAEFDTNSTFSIYYNDGTTKTLSDGELREADALMYTAALGMLVAGGETTLSTSSVYHADSLNDLLDSATADGNAALQAVKNLRDKIPQMMDNIEGGSTLLLGGVTIVTGIAVLVGSIPAGTALVIGGLTAGTYAIITGVHSEGLAWVSSKIDEASLTVSDYEFGGELADKAADAATSFALSIGSAGTKVAGGLAELAYTGWNMFTSKLESVCSTEEAAPSISLERLSTSLDDVNQFCTEIELVLLYKDYFEMSVSIAGYTGPFYQNALFFALGSINDGAPTYPSIQVASAIEPEALNDDVLLLMLSETLSEGNYTVDDSWVGEGIGIAELFFSSHEILEDITYSFQWPVGFSQTDGTLVLEHYGANYGDRLKGSFVMNVSGTKVTCLDTECENEDVEEITGTISASFDGFIKEYK
ncbi:hypothetical protein KJ877_07245 [bacterium]|nr:hypothetical protein [bacterium]MBU1990533.1 hypothetical protein [bacterium]